MSSPNLSPSEAVALMKRFVIEIQQDGNYDLIDELFQPDYFDRTAGKGQPQGAAGARDLLKHLHAAISDLKIEIVQCVSDGETVATNKILRGKLVGDLGPLKATGRVGESRVMDFVKYRDGKISEHWANVSPWKDL